MIHLTQKCAVLLPALNEEIAVADTIADFGKHFPEALIVVIDNGSTDNTSVLSRAALGELKIPGLLLFEPKRGKVHAIKKALNEIDALIWVLADCDATYPASEMRKIYDDLYLERFMHGVADRLSLSSYVNKNRMKTLLNFSGNLIFSWLAAFLTGEKQKDVFSGGRVISDALIRSIYFETTGFELEMELTLQSTALDADIRYKPIDYKKRSVGSETKLRPFHDGFSILTFTMRYVFSHRTALLLNCIAFLFAVVGVGFGVHLIAVYLDLGHVPYSSTAVLVALLLISSTMLFMCALLIQANRAATDLIRKVDFQNRQQNWNLRLNQIDG